MESTDKPIEVIPEDAEENEDGKKKLEGMEFDLDEDLLRIQKDDGDHDQELLQIQRRKSTPKVVVQEFVQVDSDEEPDDDVKPKKDEEFKEGELEGMGDHTASQVNQRPHRLRTHIEIDDVSSLSRLQFNSE